MVKMEKSNRRGGAANIRGIRYQLYYAIYRFLSLDTTEILLEWLDEDVVIINEDKSKPSMEFTQCKSIGAGGLRYSTFYNEILKRFIEIFEKLKKEESETKYSFIVACNKGLEANLERFSKIPELLQKGVPVEAIEKVYGRTLLSKICDKNYIKERPAINLFYFIQFLGFLPNLDETSLIEEIKKCLISFGCLNPDKDIDRILSYFIKKESGKITKNQLKNDLGLDYFLYKKYECTATPFKMKLTPEHITKIVGEAGEVSPTIDTIHVSIDALSKVINLAELTTDQLTYNINLYPVGTSERREIERSAEDAKEISADMRLDIKTLKETVGTISTKESEIKLLRKKFELDSEENEGEIIE